MPPLYYFPAPADRGAQIRPPSHNSSPGQQTLLLQLKKTKKKRTRREAVWISKKTTYKLIYEMNLRLHAIFAN